MSAYRFRTRRRPDMNQLARFCINLALIGGVVTVIAHLI